jgi:type IV secretory pathway TraG/TraD family ATPase VirD4
MMCTLLTRGRPRKLTLGGVTLPSENEPLHVLLCGSTGTGKSTAIEEMLESITARGDRLICCDPNGSYLRQFGQADDAVFNPFDARFPGWSVFKEIRTDYDCERLARSVVSDGSGEAAAWHHYAQVLLAEILRSLLKQGEATTADLLRWTTVEPAARLGELVAGTPAQGLFDPEAAKALASTRFVLASRLAPHRFLRPGAFSLRDWLESGEGNLFLTWRADMQAALAPLLGTAVDVLANAVLSSAADHGRRVWLILDELAALGALASLETALTMGRKHGLCVVAGLQSTAQLDRIYGRHSATVLRSCFRNLLALGVARSDPDTADYLSRALGEREVLRRMESRGTGSLGASANTSLQLERERLILASEIGGLPNLRGYLALAGTDAIQPVRLTPKARLSAVPAFVEVEAC